MVFREVGLPVKLAHKNAPADVGRFFNCRMPLAPLDYGETCACLFRDITHMQHLHSADRVVGRTHRLCGQIKAALWLLSERKCSQSEAELRLRVAGAACEGELSFPLLAVVRQTMPSAYASLLALSIASETCPSESAQIYHLWWYICAHPVNRVNMLPRLSSVLAFVIPYRSRFHFRHWGEWIVGKWFLCFLP